LSPYRSPPPQKKTSPYRPKRLKRALVWMRVAWAGRLIRLQCLKCGKWLPFPERRSSNEREFFGRWVTCGEWPRCTSGGVPSGYRGNLEVIVY